MRADPPVIRCAATPITDEKATRSRIGGVQLRRWGVGWIGLTILTTAGFSSLHHKLNSPEGVGEDLDSTVRAIEMES
jgi:hypothetical protein